MTFRIEKVIVAGSLALIACHPPRHTKTTPPNLANPGGSEPGEIAKEPDRRQLRIYATPELNLWGTGMINYRVLGSDVDGNKLSGNEIAINPIGARVGVTVDFFQRANINYQYALQGWWLDRGPGTYNYADIIGHRVHSLTVGVFPLMSRVKQNYGEENGGFLVEAGLAFEKYELGKGLLMGGGWVDGKELPMWTGATGGFYYWHVSEDTSLGLFGGSKIGIKYGYFPGKFFYILPGIEFPIGVGL